VGGEREREEGRLGELPRRPRWVRPWRLELRSRDRSPAGGERQDPTRDLAWARLPIRTPHTQDGRRRSRRAAGRLWRCGGAWCSWSCTW